MEKRNPQKAKLQHVLCFYQKVSSQLFKWASVRVNWYPFSHLEQFNALYHDDDDSASNVLFCLGSATKFNCWIKFYFENVLRKNNCWQRTSAPELVAACMQNKFLMFFKIPLGFRNVTWLPPRVGSFLGLLQRIKIVNILFRSLPKHWIFHLKIGQNYMSLLLLLETKQHCSQRSTLHDARTSYFLNNGKIKRKRSILRQRPEMQQLPLQASSLGREN